MVINGSTFAPGPWNDTAVRGRQDIMLSYQALTLKKKCVNAPMEPAMICVIKNDHCYHFPYSNFSFPISEL